ncbi:hypothetical protein DL96DRAFT_122103, partial [Flagelloscypha sp. PMI_526]
MPAAQELYSSQNFTRISHEIWYRTKSETTKAHVGSPEAILIFAWMGASPQHVLKYAAIHQKTYPSASQIIIECSPSFYLKTPSQQKAKWIPLIPLLKSLNILVSSPDVKPAKSLLHVFSNGGACGLITLGVALSNSRAQDPTYTAIIFDSTPSKARLMAGVRAFTVGIRNIFLLPIAQLSFTILLFLLVIIPRLIGKKYIIEKAYECMSISNDLGGLPFVGLGTKRLFVYGKRDVMIPYKDAQEVAETQLKRGHDVKQVTFPDSAHVAHARDYPEKYWGAVRDLVESSF